jgi:hypothetical protein
MLPDGAKVYRPPTKSSGVTAGAATTTKTPEDTLTAGASGEDVFGTSSTSGSSTSVAATEKPVIDLSKKPVKWNPPPHKMTKAPRFEWHSDSYATDIPNPTTNDYPGNPSNPADLYRVKAGRLGALYTWDFTANFEPTPEEKESEEYKSFIAEVGETSDLALGRFSQRYGVIFHYNPTSISYRVGSNEQIPAMNTAGDTGNLIIPGAASVGIDLYFNRIYDLAYIDKNSKRQYERPLTYADMNGIWDRGTEYDIEYLYRTCNGDPGDVFNVDYKTADYGFFMRIPLVLHIGAMTWIGFLTDVSVNHILFNTNMIPTFTQVHIEFARMITMGNASAKNATGDSDYVAGMVGSSTAEAGESTG